MSLVNDVLRDLERDAPDRVPTLRGGHLQLRAAPGAPSGRPPWIAVVLGMLGLASMFAGGAAMWARSAALAAPSLPPVSAAPPATRPTMPPPTPEQNTPAPNPLRSAAPPVQPRIAPIGVEQRARPGHPELPGLSRHRIVPDSERARRELVFSEPRVQKTPLPPSRAQRAQAAYRGALVLLRQGSDEKADALLERALELNPDLRRARERLAALWAKRGALTEAGRLLEEGLARTPGFPPFAIALARIRVETGGVDEAIEVLESALPPIDAEPSAHAFLAALYQRSGNYERSARIYARVLDRAPEQALWWVGMGISLESSGNDRGAVAAYQMARLRSRHRELPTAPRKFLDARLRELGGIDP